MDHRNLLPHRSADVDVADFGLEFVVFDPRNSMVHLLSEWMAVVFDACDGACTQAELATQAAAYWHGDVDESQRRVEEAVQAFWNLGLLVGAEPMIPPPCLGCTPVQAERRRSWRTRR